MESQLADKGVEEHFLALLVGKMLAWAVEPGI